MNFCTPGNSKVSTGPVIRWSRAAMYVLAGLVLVSILSVPGIRTVHAAIQPGGGDSRIFSRLMPRSPLVERLQVLLSGLDIYHGDIDGRLNDDLTAAVRLYQARTGLAIDGKVSEELLAHVEFRRDAEELLVRLDAIGNAQRAKAREKLQSVALTRSLLEPGNKNQVADPTRDRNICYQAPTVNCLMHEAVESAKAVGRTHFRDWTYGEIAVIQARLGQVEAARQTAGRINDPRLILVTLRNIAVALAETNRLAQASEGAEIIPDNWLRADALMSFAVAQTRDGNWPGARQTIQDIQDLVSAPVGEDVSELRRTSLITDLAVDLLEAGDPKQALQLMQMEQERLEGLAEKNGAAEVSASLNTLAAGFARIDMPGKAQELIEPGQKAVHRRPVSVALARAYGRAGDDKSATAIINGLEEARYRAILLADVSRFQVRSGRPEQARLSLQRAEAAAEAISSDQKFAINHARERIVAGWILLGNREAAGKTVSLITDAGIRAGAWWNVSQAQQEAGNSEGAAASEALALASVARVKSPLDRVWLYSGQVQKLVEQNRTDQAHIAFAQALDVVRGIRHSWTRAQALVRLVRAFSVLPGPIKTANPDK